LVIVVAPKFDEKKMVLWPFKQGKHPCYIQTAVDEPEGFLGFEDYKPENPPTQNGTTWTFWHDEVQYVISGKCKTIYSDPPHTGPWKEAIVGPGDFYLIKRGTCARFEVIGNEPFRHLFVIMPRPPGYTQ